MTSRLGSWAGQAARDAAYLAVGCVTSVLAAVIWPLGLGLSIGLAILVIGLPVIVATGVAFRWTAELDRRNAALVGRRLRGHYRPRRPGFRGQLTGTLNDPQTWRDLAWLVVHSVLGLTIGCVALGVVALACGLIVLPAWAWSLPDGIDVGIWHLDGVDEAFAGVPVGLILLPLSVGLLRVSALAEVSIAAALLEGSPSPEAPTVEAPAAAAPRTDPVWDPTRGLVEHLVAAVAIALVVTLLWAFTGFGYFWPMWVWLGVGATFAFHVVAARAVTRRERRMGASVDICLVIGAINVLVWAMSGFGYFWPIWPIFGMAVVVGIKALIEYRHELPWVRERRLVQRVEELTRTRAGALDVQAEELRRIERDLHDGAQARLVALSMLVGRAEAQLDDRPEVAELVRQARDEAGAAIRELRDLARGIAPPVLADRGLTAAVESLAVRSPMPVDVEAPTLGRLAPAVETAAYFVVAEALTNAAKHGAGAPAAVRLERRGDVLRVEVADSGPGGADPGRGTGLAGLRSRVAALDGTLTVVSPSGEGTTIVAELPCGS